MPISSGSPVKGIFVSGVAKVASDTSRSSGWAAWELPSSEGLDPYAATDAPAVPTPSFGMSRQNHRRLRQMIRTGRPIAGASTNLTATRP